jgi:small subunit ribosomal protein S4
MGHPRKARKQYDTPSHPWNADRIKSEKKLVLKYGLRTKKEIWKAETTIKRYRRDARFLLGMETEHAEVEKSQLLNHIIRLGMLKANGKLEDILDLTVEDVLRRRLETVVHNLGIANTAKQARIFIVHGHIAMNGRKINAPGYMVKTGEEQTIGFYSGSPMEKIMKEPTKPTAAEEKND